MLRKVSWQIVVATSILVFGVGAFPASATLHVVDQVGLTFDPPAITIDVGDTVEWHWSSGFHTVTEGTPCTPSGGFDELLTSSNPIVSVTFNTPGVIDYFCIPHCFDEMTGVITVTQGSAVPTVSEWGLLGMTLMGLTAGTILIGRRQAPVQA